MGCGARVTTADLEAARVEHEALEESWANYTGNNPNKFSSRRESARLRVEDLTAALKAQGDLPMTDHEALCAKLESIAPNAHHGDVIEHDGKRYRRRFYPRRMSRSGESVMLWGNTWDLVS